MADLLEMLRYVVEQSASDLHLKAGSPPRVRVHGKLVTTPFPTLHPADTEMAVLSVLPPQRVEEFERSNEADFSVSVSGLGRFRASAFRQRGSAGMVLRRVMAVAASASDLGLPQVVCRLADEVRGLLLVTGPTGSGKTSTLAAMIDHINSTRPVNIVTIEDPIEVMHADKMAIVNQREIGTDTRDYAEAMRRVLRQDPDVILIGEMRDPETVMAALSAAETGHLVLSTLHTGNATETINRVVDFFPPHQHHQIRLTLAANLRGVVSQRLLPRADGPGRVAAVEVLVMTGRIADRIIDPQAAQGESIEEIVAGGEYYGMQTFDQHLLALFRDGRVALRDALVTASNPHDLRVRLEAAGLVQPIGR